MPLLIQRLREKVIFLFRLGTVIFSLYTLAVQFVLINTGIFTQARIVKMNCQHIPIISIKHCLPILRFATLDEKFVEYPLSFQESFMVNRKLGDKLGVFYARANPKDIRVDSFMGKYLTIIFSVIVGTAALFINARPIKVLDDLT